MAREHVHLVDDVDLESTRGRCEARLLKKLLNIGHAAVGGRIDLDVINKTTTINRLTGRALPAGLGHRACLTVEGFGKDSGQGGLAHPA